MLIALQGIFDRRALTQSKQVCRYKHFKCVIGFLFSVM